MENNEWGAFLWSIGYTSEAWPLGHPFSAEQLIVQADDITFSYDNSHIKGLMTNSRFICKKEGLYKITYSGRGAYTSSGVSRPQKWSIIKNFKCKDNDIAALTKGLDTVDSKGGILFPVQFDFGVLASGSFKNAGGSWTNIVKLKENDFITVLASAKKVRFDGCIRIEPISFNE